VTVRKARLLLTERAISDIRDIEAYSIAEWGKRTAARYLSDVEAALLRVQENPDLLRPEQDFHPNLRFYRVNKHLLVCDVQPKAIVLLTVMGANRDIPSRLAELAPSLAAEVELLHAKLSQKKKR
jgi:plasmid stabilization system protein ParE